MTNSKEGAQFIMNSLKKLSILIVVILTALERNG
jgi:hypothetical protein